jgi:hypothetical protein
MAKKFIEKIFILVQAKLNSQIIEFHPQVLRFGTIRLQIDIVIDSDSSKFSHRLVFVSWQHCNRRQTCATERVFTAEKKTLREILEQTRKKNHKCILKAN